MDDYCADEEGGEDQSEERGDACEYAADPDPDPSGGGGCGIVVGIGRRGSSIRHGYGGSVDGVSDQPGGRQKDELSKKIVGRVLIFCVSWNVSLTSQVAANEGY